MTGWSAGKSNGGRGPNDGAGGDAAGGDDTVWRTEGSAWVGQRLLRRFGRGVVMYGVVVGWLPAAENEGTSLWHVVHDDDDEEDLDAQEVASSVAAYKENPKEKDEAATGSGGGAAGATLKMRIEPPEPLVLAPNASEADRAAWRGLDFIAALAEDDAHFAQFGADIILTFSQV